MSSLLVRNASLVVTMDADRRELTDCDILVRDGVVVDVGSDLDAPDVEELDASGCLVTPGLVNTHNHAFGTLFRAVPDLHRVHSSEWIAGLVRALDGRIFPSDAMHAAALAHYSKSLLTGCTFTADNHWFYQKGGPRDYVDRSIDAAKSVGIRLHISRGCMTRVGHIPDQLIEDEGAVLEHSQELIDRYHDPSDNAMVRIFLAPTGVDTDTAFVYAAMREIAGRNRGVQLHTHLYPGYGPRVESCNRLTGVGALQFLEDVGWVGEDVVLYHFTTNDPTDIERVTDQESWVSVCPAMDMRMSFAGPEGMLPPIRELLDASGKVCLGSSNQAMNEGTVLLHDMRIAWLADRMRFSEPERWLTSRDVLWMVTRGACLALGREDLGAIEPGKGADLAVFDLTGIEMACHTDPIPALYGYTGFTKATVVNGRVVAREGKLVNVDQNEVAREANQWAQRLVTPVASWPPDNGWSTPPTRRPS